MSTKSRKKTVLVLLATALVLFMMFPYYYMLIQSLAPWEKVDQSLTPAGFSLDSFRFLMTNGGNQNPYMWLRALANSVIVTTTTSLLAVVTGMLVGYAIIKLRFAGHRFVFNVLLFQMFFPAIIMLVPIYLMMKPLANTYPGMILPTSVSLWAIFMFINYFKTLPEEVFEAARLDGASEFRILWIIGFPAARTVAVIVFLSIFMGRWSELMWDMLIAPNIKMQTLNVLITTQFKPMGNLPGPLYAASVILTLPIVALCLAFSRYFKEGLTFNLK
ncbi:carbohydrate ABC transporter permease [Spirochaeta lutea]|uniref:Sugar ABC transporter permease n=1 Tax=Spirochaeta lutea TaxID=1480694 RepID=A0A098QTH3_9SPIO|nr:carbohydrate ABC transporter permease [Spirochaeta lutea]KGE70811.1 sugar ABC transporter permease [Spirochaeta lutea]